MLVCFPSHSPLYRIISKLNPTRFGSRNVFLVKSHVPSPTTMVFESYVATPGGDMSSSGVGAMMAATAGVDGQNKVFEGDS